MPTIQAFASHDWGVDGVNHARVATVVKGLRKRGVRVWFDETHMKGNILDAMCRGMDGADVILVFVTRNYMKKVEALDDTDNVRREFMYASGMPKKMVPIRFDRDLPATWSGPLRMVLGTSLYVDLSDEVLGERHFDSVMEAIRRATPRTMWKAAATQINRKTITLRQPAVPSSAPKTMRTRVKRLKEMVGDTEEVAHIGPAIDRLTISLLGSAKAGTLDNLVDKLTIMERELGLA